MVPKLLLSAFFLVASFSVGAHENNSHVGDIIVQWLMPVCFGGHGGRIALGNGQTKVVYDSKDCSADGEIGPLSCTLDEHGLLSGSGYYSDSFTKRYLWKGVPVAPNCTHPDDLGCCSSRDEDGASCCFYTGTK
mmetsp:Transcript_28525/g.56069  ORF Transcript_28525/g.56069 Transcript_28525/m.56069 type:complete len:134 (+) Transcript_28525:107-508(+)